MSKAALDGSVQRLSQSLSVRCMGYGTCFSVKISQLVRNALEKRIKVSCWDEPLGARRPSTAGGKVKFRELFNDFSCLVLFVFCFCLVFPSLPA